jgi:hypothetical protein
MSQTSDYDLWFFKGHDDDNLSEEKAIITHIKKTDWQPPVAVAVVSVTINPNPNAREIAIRMQRMAMRQHEYEQRYK